MGLNFSYKLLIWANPLTCDIDFVFAEVWQLIERLNSYIASIRFEIQDI